MIPVHSKTVYNDTCTQEHPQSQHYYLHTTPTVPALLPALNTHSPSTTTCTQHPQSQHYYLHTTPTVPALLPAHNTTFSPSSVMIIISSAYSHNKEGIQCLFTQQRRHTVPTHTTMKAYRAYSHNTEDLH